MIVQNIFRDNICLLSGCQRSGKSLITAILPSLKKIEIINKEPVLGAIFSMYQTGELSNKAANYLISFVSTSPALAKPNSSSCCVDTTFLKLSTAPAVCLVAFV